MRFIKVLLLFCTVTVWAVQPIKINSSAVLNWSSVPGASSYIIYRAASAGACTPTIGAGCTAIKSGVQCCGYTDRKVSPGTWYYVVTAFNLSGSTQSGPSNQVTAVIP